MGAVGIFESGGLPSNTSIFGELKEQAAEIIRKYDAQVYIPGHQNFSDSALTTIAVNDGSVGGVKGQVLGPELVTNGDFGAGSTGWGANNGASLSIVNGALRITNGSAFGGAHKTVTIGLTVGNTYIVKFDYLGGTSSAVTANTQSGQVIGPFTTATGPKSAVFTALSSNFFLFVDGTIGNYGDFDNISVREIGPIATQTTAGFKPLLTGGARNLLTFSRDFTSVNWSRVDTSAARTQVGFDGAANSACLMTEGTAGTAQINQSNTVPVGSTLVLSAYLARGNTDWVRMLIADSTVTDISSAWFNLATGALGTTSVSGLSTLTSSSITSVGGGYYRCTVTCKPNTTYTSAQIRILSAASNGSTSRVNNATYILDAAQLELGSIASPYVPTTSAAASSGSRPRSWLFDGTDDRLSLSGPVFQMSDDHFVVACGKSLGGAGSSTFLSHGPATDAARCATLQMSTSGFASATWRDDALTLVSISGSVDLRGSTHVLAATKQGNNKKLFTNGVQTSTTNSAVLGASTITLADIGRLQAGASYFNGPIHGIIAGKGAISDAELLILERYLGSLGGVTI